MLPENFAELQALIIDAIVHIAAALAILLVGRWFAGVVRRYLGKALQRTHVTTSVALILERTVFFATLAVFAFIALVVLGIPAQALIAIVVVGAIIAAVALRESLRDFAATVNFIIFQPFKVGDQIDTNGVTGTVEEILLLNTVLITFDQRKVFIPNGNIQNNNLINYSAKDKLRLDLPVPLSYRDDFQKARDTLLEIARKDERVLSDPPPFVDLMELGENGMSLMLRVHTKPEDFWALRPALNEEVKRVFGERGLTIPFPQLDLHVNQTTNS